MKKKYLLNLFSKTTPFYLLEVLTIVGLAIIPLFVSFPYRINIFLAWEGAYRLSLGQIPFKDFGMPLGFGFWLIPALFFKIFGPYLFTLIKAQVFINIVAGLAFSNILRNLAIKPAIKFFTILVFCLSYSFINFWPWYNHTVFVYQLLSINFLLIASSQLIPNKNKFVASFLSALFIFLSLFTKQDGGGLAFAVNFFLIIYFIFVNKDYKLFWGYSLSFIFISIIFVYPLISYDFLYWFNYGQEPHSSRTLIMDFLNNIFLNSQWIKFYFLIIIVIIIAHTNFKTFFYNKSKFSFTLLVMGILVQAILVQTTSYIPHNVNIYFHSFAFAYILSFFADYAKINFQRIVPFLLIIVSIIFWWSSDYWNYGQRIITKTFPSIIPDRSQQEVSISTWIVRKDTVKTSREDWITPDLKSFEHIYMPPETVKGINYIKSLPVVSSKATSLKVLNMSELTPLAYELGYDLETGPQIPLWYHKNVAIFEEQIADYCAKIENQSYDLVLFEYINYLNNFYPEEIRACLNEHYMLVNSFLAPREIQNSYIEVYIKK